MEKSPKIKAKESMKYIDYVKRNIRRTPYQAITASMVMFFTFLVVSIFTLIGLGSEKALKHLESKPQAIAFFKDGTPDEDIQAIQNALYATGRISSLKYISKEQALEIYKDRNKNDPLMLELVTASILPTSLEISTFSPLDLAPVVELVKKEPVVEDVIFPSDVVEALSNVTQMIRWTGSLLVIFMMVFATLIVLMVIGFKIRIRRTEIEIMRLLGATSWFVRSPFLLEGMFYGLIGAFFGWMISYIMLWYFTPFIQKNLSDLNLLPVSPLFMIALLLTELFIACLIGAFGSYGAVRRYLRL